MPEYKYKRLELTTEAEVWLMIQIARWFWLKALARALVLSIGGELGSSVGIISIGIVLLVAVIPLVLWLCARAIKRVVLIPCEYCNGLMPQTSVFCPNCGARRTV